MRAFLEVVSLNSWRIPGARVLAAKFALQSVCLVFVGASAVACGDCDFETEQIRRFVNDPANLQCTTEADCSLRGVPSCMELEEAGCGQVVMSKSAAESARWQEIEADARDCSSESCPNCNALRVATCQQGVCR